MQLRLSNFKHRPKYTSIITADGLNLLKVKVDEKKVELNQE